jgi:hypothetical protein
VRKIEKVIFLGITGGERFTMPPALFCFLKTVWYHRGNVIHLQPKEKKAQNHPWFSRAPGNADRPTCPFSSSRKRPPEIGRLIGFFIFLPLHFHRYGY